MSAYTVDEAATKWCPHIMMTWARLDPADGNWNTSGHPAFNAAKVERSECFHRPGCIGSSCSQWRWLDRSTSVKRRGYCGLAGRPA